MEQHDGRAGRAGRIPAPRVKTALGGIHVNILAGDDRHVAIPVPARGPSARHGRIIGNGGSPRRRALGMPATTRPQQRRDGRNQAARRQQQIGSQAQGVHRGHAQQRAGGDAQVEGRHEPGRRRLHRIRRRAQHPQLQRYRHAAISQAPGQQQDAGGQRPVAQPGVQRQHQGQRGDDGQQHRPLPPRRARPATKLPATPATP